MHDDELAIIALFSRIYRRERLRRRRKELVKRIPASFNGNVILQRVHSITPLKLMNESITCCFNRSVHWCSNSVHVNREVDETNAMFVDRVSDMVHRMGWAGVYVIVLTTKKSRKEKLAKSIGCAVNIRLSQDKFFGTPQQSSPLSLQVAVRDQRPTHTDEEHAAETASEEDDACQEQG